MVGNLSILLLFSICLLGATSDDDDYCDINQTRRKNDYCDTEGNPSTANPDFTDIKEEPTCAKMRECHCATTVGWPFVGYNHCRMDFFSISITMGGAIIREWYNRKCNIDEFNIMKDSYLVLDFHNHHEVKATRNQAVIKKGDHYEKSGRFHLLIWRDAQQFISNEDRDNLKKIFNYQLVDCTAGVGTLTFCKSVAGDLVLDSNKRFYNVRNIERLYGCIRVYDLDIDCRTLKDYVNRLTVNCFLYNSMSYTPDNPEMRECAESLPGKWRYFTKKLTTTSTSTTTGTTTTTTTSTTVPTTTTSTTVPTTTTSTTLPTTTTTTTLPTTTTSSTTVPTTTTTTSTTVPTTTTFTTVPTRTTTTTVPTTTTTAVPTTITSTTVPTTTTFTTVPTTITSTSVLTTSVASTTTIQTTSEVPTTETTVETTTTSGPSHVVTSGSQDVERSAATTSGSEGPAAPTSGPEGSDAPTSGANGSDASTSGPESSDAPTSGQEGPDASTFGPSGPEGPDATTSGPESSDAPTSGPVDTGNRMLQTVAPDNEVDESSASCTYSTIFPTLLLIVIVASG